MKIVMGSTIADPEVEEQTETQELDKEESRYAVIIFDDDTHSYAYVVEMMMNLFKMSAQQGFDIAYEVDHIGQATVKICPKDEALKAKQAIQAYGPDHRMEISKGPMACCIEPAD